MAEVNLRGISKSFGNISAVQNLTLPIEDGSFMVLLGPTGAGKTTTLRLLAGLEEVDTGEVWIGDRNVSKDTPAQRNVAMVFQQYSLYPHMSVRDNLAFPLRSPLLRTPADVITQKVQQVASMLHIEHKLDNKATELSGGEMQRVSIGRALVRNPDIYLMDEPLSSLDAKLRAELRLELKRLQADLGATVLYVTHDQVEAMTMATHIGVLNEGQLVQYGTPREIYEQPASLYVASRLGLPRINMLPADLFGRAPAEAQQMGLRPEHIQVRQGADATSATEVEPLAVVHRVEALGDQTRLHLQCGEHPLVTLIDPDASFDQGETVRVAALNPLFFDAEGNRLTTGIRV